MMICGGLGDNGGMISVMTLRAGYSYAFPDRTGITLRSILGGAGGSSRITIGGGVWALRPSFRKITGGAGTATVSCSCRITISPVTGVGGRK